MTLSQSQVCWIVVALGFVNAVASNDDLPDCARITSINTPNSKLVRTIDNYGINANTHNAYLTSNPGKFRLKRGGFFNIKGAVAMESLNHPGYFLRHKNYKFRLEKSSANTMFKKDATFYLLRVQDDPALFAFELYSHPSWFMAHKQRKPFTLTLQHVTGADQRVMDSTFYISPLNCKKSLSGKMVKQVTASKKTSILGNNKTAKKKSILDGMDDDEHVDVDDGTAVSYTEEFNSHPKESIKDQDLVTEVEKAFNSSISGKNDKVLNDLESDIERKVDGLASKLISIKAKKIIKQAHNSEDDPSKTPLQTLADLPDSSGVSTGTDNDDVIVHVDSGTNIKENDKQSVSQDDSNKIMKGEPKAVDVQTSEVTSADSGSTTISSTGVIKGTPKLSDENGNHVEVTVRNALDKPDENAQKRGLTPNIPGVRVQQAKQAGFVQAVKLVNAAETKLKDVLSKLEDNSANAKPVVETAAKRVQPGPLVNAVRKPNVAAILAKMHSKMVELTGHQRQHINGSAGSPIQPHMPTSAKVYFTESCEDAFPESCEKWAQKRYCLTFNELMKRYCRKACSLCDHVITTGFTPCDKTCGGGVRLRMLKVNNRQVLQRRVCNINKCPINGAYTAYSNWSECSSTCGKGMMYRHRTCTNPPPQYGGHDCTHLGSPVQTKPCHVACKDQEMDDDQENEEDDNSADTGSGSEDDETVAANDNPTDQKQNDDFDRMPEYQMEGFNEAPGYTIQTVEEQKKMEADAKLKQIHTKGYKWTSKHHRKSPLILHQIKGDVFEQRDRHGHRHLLEITKDHDRGPHFKTVHYNKKPVAKLRCGPSMFLKYHRREGNFPEEEMSASPQGNFMQPAMGMTSTAMGMTNPAMAGQMPSMNAVGQGLGIPENFKRSTRTKKSSHSKTKNKNKNKSNDKNKNKKRGLDFQNYKVYEGGKFMYDKYGMPMDTTKEVIKAFDSPYKIILTKNKKNQMVISEECLESDAGVNPEMDTREDSIQELESYVGPNGLSGTVRIPDVKHKTNTALTSNGFYEYKYENPSPSDAYTVSVTEQQREQRGNTIGKEIKQALDKAENEESRAITKSSLMSGARATLAEELAAEDEEAQREKKFEDKQRKSKLNTYRSYGR